MNANVSAPMPMRAASLIVSRFEHATQSGGCGRWTGFGTTLRHGIEKYFPSKPGYGFIASIRAVSRTDSSHISRFSMYGTPNPSSSSRELDSPVPHSTRPFETRSRVAMRSATRAGWL